MVNKIWKGGRVNASSKEDEKGSKTLTKRARVRGVIRKTFIVKNKNKICLLYDTFTWN